MNHQVKAPTYFFVSDLHIGGDGKLNYCHFEKELIQFLKDIAQHPGPTELIIVGDFLGLWEMPSTPIEKKIPGIAKTHQLLFDQFQQTGEKIRITVIPGNHDHEMTWVPGCSEQLQTYNIHLEPIRSITRRIGGRKIWIEHGNQYEPFNRFAEFGNRFATPFGFYITSEVSARAGRVARRPSKHFFKRSSKSDEWIGDLESVYPNEDIPIWIISKYFFKELTPLLRWVLFPFLILFGLSVIIVVGIKLETLQVLPTNIFRQRLGQWIGFPGKVIDLIILVNEVVILLMLALSIPIGLLVLDIRRTLRSFGIDLGNKLKIMKKHLFVDAAKGIFNSDPDVAIFLYGHTHIPSLTEIDDRCIINTGTWLRRLVRTKPIIGLFPPVFIDSFQLNYFQIDETETGDIRIKYFHIPKPIKSELTRMEKLLTFGRKKKDLEVIPSETILPGAGKSRAVA